ncbi:MAG TPA: hypothetical protein VK194_11415 [Candidatus Deferrimicrobium sp.]|nr:hypothetical protein [Candidatus Deferrimicrobium sp.]
MGRDDRIEYGSDAHWFDTAGGPTPAASEYPWGSSAVLFGSGRDAMRVLVAWGAREHGWRRVWLPSYYCQDVPAALCGIGPPDVELCAYPDAPDRPDPGLHGLPVTRGDVVVVANQLGTRRRPADLGAAARDAVIVEDHSHDLASPWAMTSRAHYAIASLRKTLPLPDGGVVWSPQALALPPEPALTEAHASAALARLSAMVLKARYLAGAAVDKATYLAEARSGAERIAKGPPSGIAPVSRAMLATFPVAAWRRKRRRNFGVLLRALGPLGTARVIRPPAGAVPFALTLVFDTAARRDAARHALIAARVYPAVLWSLDEPVMDGIPAEHVDLARRVLSIHCDQRYGAADMIRIAEIAKPLLGT